MNSDSSERSVPRTEASDSESRITIEQMARALEVAREKKWQTTPDLRPANPPAQGMPGLVERVGMPLPGGHAAQHPQASAFLPQSSAPAGVPQPQAASLAPPPQQQASSLAPHLQQQAPSLAPLPLQQASSLAPPPASSLAPLYHTPPAQPAIVVDHSQQLTPAQPYETQGAAAGAEQEGPEQLRPWMEPGFCVTTSELQATKDLSVDVYRDHRLLMGKAPSVEMKKPEMKELLQANQQLFRNRGPWHHKFPDDGFDILHPLRFEPFSQVSPDVL